MSGKTNPKLLAKGHVHQDLQLGAAAVGARADMLCGIPVAVSPPHTALKHPVVAENGRMLSYNASI